MQNYCIVEWRIPLTERAIMRLPDWMWGAAFLVPSAAIFGTAILWILTAVKYWKLRNSLN